MAADGRLWLVASYPNTLGQETCCDNTLAFCSLAEEAGVWQQSAFARKA
ncbi:hypothetical protein HRbin36_02184 [bacterium HR36]|nr:hypothetical protein HRbin36_02184 [bacterium HR36]